MRLSHCRKPQHRARRPTFGFDHCSRTSLIVAILPVRDDAKCPRCRHPAISNQQSAISNQQSAISNQRSAISDQQSAISDQQSAISNQRSAISDQRSAISNQQSAISDQQSAISNQQSAFGVRRGTFEFGFGASNALLLDADVVSACLELKSIVHSAPSAQSGAGADCPQGLHVTGSANRLRWRKKKDRARARARARARKIRPSTLIDRATLGSTFGPHFTHLATASSSSRRDVAGVARRFRGCPPLGSPRVAAAGASPST